MTLPSALRLPKEITAVSNRGMISNPSIHNRVGSASNVPCADLFSRSRCNMTLTFLQHENVIGHHHQRHFLSYSIEGIWIKPRNSVLLEHLDAFATQINIYMCIRTNINSVRHQPLK